MVRRRTNVLAFFFLSLLFLSIYYFIHSPYFGVTKITVDGINLLEEEEVIRLSGVRNGENLWRLDESRIQEQLFFHPHIKDVKVMRKWPSEVRLQIEERKPLAVIAQGASFVLLDSEGIYLKSIDSLRSFRIPVITGIEVTEASGPGQAFRDESISFALNVLMQFPPTLLLRIGELHVGVESRLVLYTTEGIEIRFGVAEHTQEKGEVLQEILNELALSGETNKVRYINVSSPKAPAIKPKVGAQLHGIRSMGITIGDGIYD
ncbi:cell division protein FtsQ/DivIB [Heliorestis convoluta]|uniref:FtsQ-type POTRA domain-containing protein n=1 Tax=Heliorestis convoluta TaxID=356322 RepID=A0A5Q2MYX0_9FIRM|nr:FtsQ-type POTRA domain-containing protein [Heliorestis convoluta]QGG47857.1 FtsQ-type POTRA domain-containing protein [Heliorestis convoluta]